MQWPPARPADPGRAAIHRPQADRDLPAWLLAAISVAPRPDLAVALPEAGTERPWSCQADDAWQDQGP